MACYSAAEVIEPYWENLCTVIDGGKIGQYKDVYAHGAGISSPWTNKTHFCDFKPLNINEYEAYIPISIHTS